MSLINRMLRDLDARRAPADELPAQVRPLPVANAGAPAWGIVAGTALMAAAAGAVAWLYWGTGQAPGRAVPAGPPILAPASLPVAPTAPAAPPDPAAAALPSGGAPVADAGSTAPTPPMPAAMPPPAAPNVADPAPAAAAVLAESGLKVAGELSRPPEARPEAPPAVKPRPAAPPQAPAMPTSSSPAAPPAAKTSEPAPAARAPGPAADAASGRIEKQAIAATAREKAEEAFRRAQQATTHGRGLQAQAELQAALREDPSYGTARLLLAQTFVEQGRAQDARALLADGLAADPAQPRLALALARLQVERNDLEEAIRVLRRAAPPAAGSPEFRGYLAGILQKAGHAKEAIEEYQATVRLSPQTGIWWMGLGLSLEADGRTAEAREAYQKARASGTLSPELAAFVEQKLR